MRQRGGWKIYKDEDKGHYGVAVYDSNIEGSPPRRVYFETEDDFKIAFYRDTNYGQPKDDNFNMTVSYEMDNNIHYLLYKYKNAPY